MGKWNSNSIYIFFFVSHDIEKQIRILLFVFRFRITLKTDDFAFGFLFSHHFEKRGFVWFVRVLLCTYDVVVSWK